MSTQSHPLMIHGTDGELQDTKNLHDHNSPEASFAKDLTDNYHYIGQYFPMFLHLYKSLLHSLQEGANVENIKVPCELLDRMQKQVQNNIRQTIDSLLYNIITQLGSNLYLIDQREIRSAIDSQVTDGIITGNRDSSSSRYTLQSHVHDWLRNRYYKNSLLNYVVNPHQMQPTLTDFRNIVYENNCQKLCSFQAKIQCKWIPAVLLVTDEITCSNLCYGGVIIAPKIEQGYVPFVPSSKINLTTARRQDVAGISRRTYRTVYGSNKCSGNSISRSKIFARGYESNNSSHTGVGGRHSGGNFGSNCGDSGGDSGSSGSNCGGGGCCGGGDGGDDDLGHDWGHVVAKRKVSIK